MIIAIEMIVYKEEENKVGHQLIPQGHTVNTIFFVQIEICFVYNTKVKSALTSHFYDLVKDHY